MNNTNQSLEQTLALLNEALKEIAENKQPESLTFTRTVNFHCSKGDTNYGKGITWTGQGGMRQLVFSKPDSIFSSENFNLDRSKSYYINGESVLSQNELGAAVTKSSLTEVGRLKGLIVDGSVSVGQNLYYNAKTKKLGIGTETPGHTLTLAENGTELGLGLNSNRSYIYSNNSLDLGTAGISRLSLESNGDIRLGNSDQAPAQISMHGRVSIKVATPDPNVDLHVNGPVRLHGRLYTSADSFPTSGVNHQGDIVWNANPVPGQPIGWVCIRSGNPGTWAQFGTISHLG